MLTSGLLLLVLGAAQPVSVDLAEALRLGLAHDRDVRISRLSTDAARAAARRAGATYQPQVNLKASGALASPTPLASGAAASASRYGVDFQVSQLLFDTGRGLYSLYTARESLTAADFAELEAELTAAARIATDFLGLLGAQASEKLAAELTAQAQRQVDLAQARLDAKKGSQLDLTRAKVTLTNLVVQQQTSADSTRVSLATLRNDLGLEPATPLAVRDQVAVPAVETSLAEALAQARLQRPQLAVAAANQRAARLGVTAVRLRRWADLQVNAAYTNTLAGTDGGGHDYSLGATLKLPLWDGQSAKAEVDAAVAAWKQADERLLQTGESIQLAVEQQHLLYTDAVAQLTAADEAVRLAAESLQNNEEGYRLGVASFLDLSDARTQYAQAETARINARLARDKAAVRLRVAIGHMPLLSEKAAALGRESGK